MNNHSSTGKSGALLMVGMLSIISLGVVGALVYNQQLHIYNNKAKERSNTAPTIQQNAQENMQNSGTQGEMLNDNDVLPPDPTDPTSRVTMVNISNNTPADFAGKNSTEFRGDL